MPKKSGRPQRHRVGSSPKERGRDKNEKPLWFSLRVAAEHAKTQIGVDIRQQLLDSYERGGSVE